MNPNFPVTDPAEQPANPAQNNKVKEPWSSPTLTKVSAIENTLTRQGNTGNDGGVPSQRSS